MKRTLAVFGFVLSSCVLLPAQEGERVVVPARNSSRPRVVNVSSMNGSITVNAYQGKEVIVEVNGGAGGRRRESQTSPDGLKRLELPGRSGLEVEDDDNVITVRTAPNAGGNIVVTVPVNTSLNLKCINGGAIVVDGVNGEVDANDLNGRIQLNNISGSVIAHSLNGSVTVSMNRVDPGKPLSFSTLNGGIDVTLPPDFKANLKLRADNGDIYSDFDIKFDGGGSKPITENSNGRDGKFRVKFDKTIYGTLNGGGPEVSFITSNGRISIRKKK
jgi:Putative adhesin